MVRTGLGGGEGVESEITIQYLFSGSSAVVECSPPLCGAEGCQQYGMRCCRPSLGYGRVVWAATHGPSQPAGECYFFPFICFILKAFHAYQVL